MEYDNLFFCLFLYEMIHQLLNKDCYNYFTEKFEMKMRKFVHENFADWVVILLICPKGCKVT